MIGPTRSRRALLQLPWLRSIAASLSLLLLLSLTACEREDISAVEPIIHVRVHDDGLEPHSVTVRAPDKAAVVVQNDTDTACAFSFGPWVKDMQVPANGEASVHFTVSDFGSGEAEMRCEGREGLTGRVEVLRSTAID